MKQTDIIVNYYDSEYAASKSNSAIPVYLDGSTLYITLDAWSLNFEVYYNRDQNLNFTITTTYSGNAI